MTAPPIPVLAAYPFLRGLPLDHVALLAAHAQTIRLSDRQRLFEEGGTADRFWLIEAGQVALDTFVPGDSRVIIGQLGRGDVVGLSWLSPPYRWGYGAIATQPLQAFEFDAKAIRATCIQNPAFGYEITSRFLQLTLHRLQTTRTRLLDVRTEPELLV
jgi:CRP/FNR family transcriptional regulator, cyclic AMP receptor protein